MKKTKSIFTLMAIAITACVLSCDDQDERLEAKNNVFSNETSGIRSTSNARSAVNGTVGEPISLATAKQWAANYRKSNPGETLGHFFGFEIIQQILNQENCVGIRIYYAINDAGEKQLLLVGVDATGENLLPLEGAKIADDGDIIADASFPCPNTCPTNGL